MEEGKPNGCYSEEKYTECLKNDWIKRDKFCYHPDRYDTINKQTGKECRPCHPNAVNRKEQKDA